MGNDNYNGSIDLALIPFIATLLVIVIKQDLIHILFIIPFYFLWFVISLIGLRTGFDIRPSELISTISNNLKQKKKIKEICSMMNLSPKECTSFSFEKQCKIKETYDKIKRAIRIEYTFKFFDFVHCDTSKIKFRYYKSTLLKSLVIEKEWEQLTVEEKIKRSKRYDKYCKVDKELCLQKILLEKGLGFCINNFGSVENAMSLLKIIFKENSKEIRAKDKKWHTYKELIEEDAKRKEQEERLRQEIIKEAKERKIFESIQNEMGGFCWLLLLRTMQFIYPKNHNDSSVYFVFTCFFAIIKIFNA